MTQHRVITDGALSVPLNDSRPPPPPSQEVAPWTEFTTSGGEIDPYHQPPPPPPPPPSLPLGILSPEEIAEMLRNWSRPNAADPLDFSHLDHPAIRAAVIGAYVVVIAVGIVANGSILFLVARSKRLRTVTNIFIANLAVSDLWLCVFCLPVQLHYQLTDYWVFGGALCRAVFSAFAVPMYVSTLSMLLIAVDRYLLILHPLFRRMSTRLAVGLIAVGVVVSVALSAPVMFYASLRVIDVYNVRWYFCVEVWPNAATRKAYALASFTVQFCLPLCATSYLYLQIYARLRHRPAGLNMRTTKTTRILFSIVAVFVVCWFPWNVFSLIAEFDKNVVKGRHFKLVDLGLKGFALGSACVNPLFYCWLNENFRAELKSVTRGLKGRAGGGGESYMSTAPGGGLMEMQSCSRLDRKSVLPYGSVRSPMKVVGTRKPLRAL